MAATDSVGDKITPLTEDHLLDARGDDAPGKR